MKNLTKIALILFLLVSNTAFAGTVILTTYNSNTDPAKAIYYNQAMIQYQKNDQYPAFPAILYASNSGQKPTFLKLENVNTFTIPWIGVNASTSNKVTALNTLYIKNCTYSLKPDETKYINVYITGSIFKIDGNGLAELDTRTANCITQG